MNNALEIYKFSDQPIQIVIKDDSPWFVAKDVAACLGYASPGKAVRDHCKGGPNWAPLQTAGGKQEVRVIAEGDLYRLIAHSKLPTAQEFESWVFDEVLPSIRETGAYGGDIPKTLPEALRLAADQAERNEEAMKQIHLNAPKVAFADSIEVAQNCILVRDLAKTLKQAGFPTGGTRLMRRLRKDDYLIKTGSDRNMPTQRSVDLGIINIRTHTVLRSTGEEIVRTPVITGKGIRYFVKKYCGESGLAAVNKESS